MTPPMTAPVIGQTAPDFTLMQTGGGSLSLSAMRPGKVVLFFYPKDLTETCTKQAIAFSQALPQFAAAGVTVIGISKDGIASHDRFRAKHDLGMTLVSDPKGEVCKAYGVWVEKTMFGNTGMGIERSTFLIDGNGIVIGLWRKVRVAGHVEAVLAAATAA